MVNKSTASTRTHHSAYAGARILITGGTGSIGTDLLRTLLRESPKLVTLFTNDENGLFEAKSEFGSRSDIEYRLGDIRDPHSPETVMRNCDYVFHAAALKHVTFCEVNPYEAITTNILGTQNVIDCAIKYGVKKFVFISTDKSVNPINTLGATKLLAEKLVISASKLATRPVFSIVRFGNVIGSRGSVVLIFEKQVRDGGPITITDPNMTRFIMAPSDASELILRAAGVARPGEIFVLKMKTVRIGELAEACRIFFSRRLGLDPNRISIKRVGIQSGEKMHEELMNEVEIGSAVDSDDFYVINPNQRSGNPVLKRDGRGSLSSDDVIPLSTKAIVEELSKLFGYRDV